MLLVAVVGVVILSGLTGTSTGGKPIAEPIAAPPHVGDCVAGAVDALGITTTSSSAVLPDLPTSSCTGARDAEVVLVIDDYAAASVVVPSEDGTVRPGLREQCSLAVLTYLGVTTDATGDWSPSISWGAGHIGPSRRQADAGQTWAACVAYVPSPNGHQTEPLTGSVRDVIRHRTPDTARFGICLDARDKTPVSRTQPHSVEVFGGTVVPLETDSSTLERSCRELVSAETLMPDPTAGGALIIDVNTDSVGSATLEDGTPVQPAQCTVRPTDAGRVLTASLRQLGTTPLPLA
ncbi:septum formation family protein [Nakamurella leprariae]|uniref:Septum formation family protein n=1 Tax=Nakamurella leprariae TaxID=2803911 RepID=A0A939C3N7_9ACTN|nr:septum formation family protein [Nakamurella leprariae]MBM9469629.1 septum formation family protein [Nakamurella leprariae]